MNPERLSLVGFAIILVGFAVIAVGAFTGMQGSSSTGGFILIGPFPIVFGSGPNSGVLAGVAVALSVAMVALYLLSFVFWRSRRGRTKMERESD